MNKINQLKELLSLLNDDGFDAEDKPQSLNCHIGEYVIIRTYSAGVWFGKLEQKSGNEVILTDARRMYQWWAAKSKVFLELPNTELIRTNQKYVLR